MFKAHNETNPEERGVSDSETCHCRKYEYVTAVVLDFVVKVQPGCNSQPWSSTKYQRVRHKPKTSLQTLHFEVKMQ